MDEIDKINTVKKVLKLFTKIFISVGAFIIVIILIKIILNKKIDETDIYTLGIMLIACLFPLVILVLCYIFFYVIEKVIHSGKSVNNYNNEYVRELPKFSSPALTSFIYDLKINVYKDYTATILYLELKHYIDIVEENSKWKIKIVPQADYSNLQNCEKYVLDVIIGKTVFNEAKFKEEIIKDAQEKGLITDKKISKIPKLLLIFGIGTLLMFITYKINLILFYIYITISLTVLYVYYSIGSINKYVKYKRTDEGKKLALLFKGLKKYIHEYTLIKNKGIEYTEILENFIPYALSLDEAKAVEDFIKQNDKYRDLIYGRIY